MVKLADTPDLKSDAAGHTGSIPVTRTTTTMKTYAETILHLVHLKRHAYIKDEPFNRTNYEVVSFVFNIPLTQVEHDVNENFASGF